MDDNQKLVTVSAFESDFEAELAKVSLENAGIRCVAVEGGLGTVQPYSTPFNVELQVFEPDIERAKEILTKQEPLDHSEGV